MTNVILYHGTVHDFAEFDGHYALRGSEANSALGIHLAENPALAAEYAEMAAKDAHAGRPRVLEVAVEVSKVAVVTSREDFLGRPDDVFDHRGGVMRTREEFVAVRNELEERGFHAVACDYLGDDLTGCWVVFDPRRLTVIREIALDEACEIEWDAVSSGVDYESVRLFEDVKDESAVAHIQTARNS